ncbi:MAG: LCP family protein [Marmoricola sp.]
MDDTSLLDLLTEPEQFPGTLARRRRRWPWVLAGLGLSLVLLASLTTAGLWYLDHKITGQIGRLPEVFSSVDHRPARPTGAAGRATNILLIGSDRRSPVPTTGERARAATWIPGEQRSDTLMLVHISANRRDVTVVSIPRDSWVNIPGYGRHKVNAAFSYGGPSLAVRTVEQLTGIRIDHLAVVDWDGFRRLTDVLGGVTVRIPRTVYDSARRKTWTAGWHHLNGAQALLYVRERHGLPGGDLDRVRRQQNLLRVLFRKAARTSVWSHPVQDVRLANAIAGDLSVDSGWSAHQMLQLARQVHGAQHRRLQFTTAPVSGTGRVGAEDVVFLDHHADRGLWRAIDHDRAVPWFQQHPGHLLGGSVR